MRVPYEACPLCDAPPPELTQERLAPCTGHALYQPALPPTMRWLRCQRCDHVFTDGYYSADGLAVLHSKTQSNQIPGTGDIHRSRAIAARIVETLCRTRSAWHGRWLDVGFGSGALLTTAEEFGYSVVGLDARQGNVDGLQALGLEALRTELTDYQPDEPFDVISMADVLEHMAFPRAALEHARQILHPQGRLFLSMPNSDCFAWKQADRDASNPYWAELEHYHNFGRRRLYELLRAHRFEPCHYGVSERYVFCMEVVARPTDDG